MYKKYAGPMAEYAPPHVDNEHGTGVREPVAAHPTSSQVTTNTVSKPTTNNKGVFDLKPYPEVVAMQKELGALNQAFANSHIADLTSNKQLASMITKTINFPGAAPEKQTDLQTRIHQLSMVTKQNKGLNIFDGKWGPNTNNALNSAVFLAQGMISLSKMTNTKLPPIDYSKMYSILDDKTKLSTQEKATELTPILKQMGAAIDPFAQAMKTGAESLNKDAKLTIGNSNDLTYAEREYLKQNATARVGNLLFDNKVLTYNNLSSMNNFREFLDQNKAAKPFGAFLDQKTTQPEIMKALTDLKKQLGVTR